VAAVSAGTMAPQAARILILKAFVQFFSTADVAAMISAAQAITPPSAEEAPLA
jgi:hypothetical protein